MADNKARGFAAMSEEERRKIAKQGGHASTGSFGDKNSADPKKAGEGGAKAQPKEAKRRGGERSRRSS